MSGPFSKVEVISDVARRRRFSTEHKLAVAPETMELGQSDRYVAVALAAAARFAVRRSRRPSASPART